MEIIKLDKKHPDAIAVQKITDFLSAGKVLILPTETVYTLAVDATNKDAIKKVFEIKGRDYNKPLHIVVSSLNMAGKYVYVDKNSKILEKHFLPGPLTLVLNKRKGLLPEILTAGLSTLGIRIPDMRLNRAVSEKYANPYTTTSANISGGQNPYSVDDVLMQLAERKDMIDLVVDVGSLPNILPSTLIDLAQNPPKILRLGPVTKKDLESVLNTKVSI